MKPEKNNATVPSTSTAVRRTRRPKSSPIASEQYSSRAIGRALDVLECFFSDQGAFTLKELSEWVEMPESSLFRILHTLEAREYLRQDQSGRYTLAPRLLLGKINEQAEHLKQNSRPHLVNLARKFDETASLAFLAEKRIYVLDSVESFHEIRHSNRIGRVLPPHCSSLGKAIAAFQPQELSDEILEVYGLFPRTERTIIDRHLLYLEFERIRQAGHSCDRGEAVVGGICIGAPIHSSNGNVIAAISLSSPVIRMNEQRELQIVQAVVAAANAISNTLQPEANH